MSKELEEKVLIAQDIANKIRNGIETENGTRPFDSIDIYEILGNNNVNVKGLIDLVTGSLDNLDRETLKTFFQKHIKTENIVDKEYFLNRKIILNAKIITYEPLIKAKKSPEKIYKWVEGTGEVFTDEEKELAFKYLKNNEIPITEATFKDVKQRLIKGYLKESDLKSKTKIKKK